MTGPMYYDVIGDGSFEHGAVELSIDEHHPGKVQVQAASHYTAEPAYMTPEQARELARSLVAAADTLEGKPLSCFAKAAPNEPTFTLLGRDLAACHGITGWASARIQLGLNAFSDAQIQEALDLSNVFEKYAEMRRSMNAEGSGR